MDAAGFSRHCLLPPGLSPPPAHWGLAQVGGGCQADWGPFVVGAHGTPSPPWPGPTRSSGPPKRQRRERTVFTKEQLEALKEYFQHNEYPGYQDRLHLATRLSLEEHKVQVWFKNRRAQRSRLERLAKDRSQRARDAPTDPGGPGPAPAPVAAPAPVFAVAAAAAAAGPAFPDGPGFCSPPPPSRAGMLAAPEPSIFSHGPALWAPAPGAQANVPAASAPAPAPVWPQDPYALNFGPNPFPISVIFSRQDPSSPTSGYQTEDSFVDENDLGQAGY
ncbi:tetrapeptide repeat homeobox protein 2 [Hippopotamus amphibius kiboko]|uniref:tetrapeptide repeat homeobox protein 2 n=1 Tax=Hippopotamus amphibius kiboko TaxID=575201 RepID=UPI002592180B|nr:tetrapeptide repeat homeobox protein 2 [Hippopotamus amphibius kiboko]